jgi:hypothetical protein
MLSFYEILRYHITDITDCSLRCHYHHIVSQVDQHFKGTPYFPTVSIHSKLCPPF